MTASARVHRHLREDIITCTLPPGRSFSEGELARRYKVSRTPIREACRRLQDEGLIQIIPFRGYFVAPLRVAEFHNLQELQLIVDPAAAALAAQRANAGQLEALEACAKCEYRVGVKSSYYEFLQRNRSLHVGIAQATGNDHLAEIVAQIHTRLMRFFYPGLSMDSFGPQLVKEHCAIVEAIKSRDPERARQFAAEHVSNTIRRSARLFLTATQMHAGDSRENSTFLRELTLEWTEERSGSRNSNPATET